MRSLALGSLDRGLNDSLTGVLAQLEGRGIMEERVIIQALELAHGRE